MAPLVGSLLNVTASRLFVVSDQITGEPGSLQRRRRVKRLREFGGAYNSYSFVSSTFFGVVGVGGRKREVGDWSATLVGWLQK